MDGDWKVILTPETHPPVAQTGDRLVCAVGASVTSAAAAVPTADATCLLFPGQCAADAVTDVVTDAAGSVASSAVDAAAQSFMEAFWSFYIDWIITPWTKASSPVLAQTCGERNGSLSAATADCNDGALEWSGVGDCGLT